MILKSFYRKKTTKIYLIILTLIITILGVAIIGKNNYIEKLNSYYSNSFIYFTNDKPIDLSNIDNILEYKKAISNGLFYFTYHDDITLNENEIAMPSFLKESYKINDKLEYQENNNTIYLTIKDYYEMETVTPLVYINKDTLENITNNSKEHSYIIKLKEWSKYEEVEEYLYRTYNKEPFSLIISTSNIDLTQTIKTFTTYIYIIIGIFIIVIIFTTYNIINDEKKKTFIYRSLGYSKTTILKKQLINIFSLFGLSLISSSILIILISVFII